MFRVTCLLLFIVLSGCASFTEEHSRTILINYSTGDTQECAVDMMRTKESYDKYRECIKRVEDQGYKISTQH
jgi:hypothetical protein